MNNKCRETLRRVTQNDPSMKTLRLVGTASSRFYNGDFYSENSDNYSTFGAAIATNTQLHRLAVLLNDDLRVTNRGFYNGFKANSSICKLELYCGGENIAGGVAHEILKAYQENNSHLTYLYIYNADLQNWEDRVLLWIH